MAIYHMSVQIIKRSNGGSAVASAAYRATEKLRDETTAETFDYRRKERAIASGIIAPDGAPDWTHDRSKLWNEVEKKENRKNSQFCREMNVAIPDELKDQAENMIRAYIKANFTAVGLVADYAIHKPSRQGDERNIHAHIMVTKRKMTPDGWGDMYREADEAKTSKQILNGWRKGWEEICNYGLKQIGSAERVSCETLEAQGIDREPQQHMGKSATAIERRGETPERTRYADKQTLIDIAPEELQTALENDAEYKTLIKLLAEEKAKESNRKKIKDMGAIICAMTPDEWQTYRDENYPRLERYTTQQSLIEAIKPMLPALEKWEAERLKKAKQALAEQSENKPEIAEKPKHFASLYQYQDADGHTHTDYDEYKFAQQKCINGWEYMHDRAERNTADAKKIYSDVHTARQTNRPEDIWTVVCNTQRTRPNFFEKLKNEAEKIVETSPLFAPFRTVREAVTRWRDTKNSELEEQEYRRRKNRSPDRDRGGISR
jgi:hypothetical protein